MKSFCLYSIRNVVNGKARANKRASLLGLKRSAETCAKIKAVQNSPEMRAMRNARPTFKLSPAHAAKLRAVAYTPEVNAKRSAALRGRKLSPEHVAKLVAARRKQLET